MNTAKNTTNSAISTKGTKFVGFFVVVVELELPVTFVAYVLDWLVTV